MKSRRPLPFLALLASLAPAALLGGDWFSLFDGQSLAGWTKHGGGAFDVRDGMIVGHNGPGRHTYLCTDRRFADFELEFDVRIDGAINSGVQLRSEILRVDTAGGVNEDLLGPQIDLEPSPGKSGYLLVSGPHVWLTPGAESHPNDLFQNGAWNHGRILAEGPRIRAWINDRLVTDLTDGKTFAAHPAGVIALQLHRSPEPTGTLGVSWRNLRLRELSAPAP